MKALLVVALVALIQGTFATLIIKGPAEPVLDGQRVILECLYLDSDLNITQVHFEYGHAELNLWRRVRGSILRQWFCYSGGPDWDEENTGHLYIPNPLRYSDRSFRCVSEAENVTAPDNASEPLTLKVHYMENPWLSRKGYSSYLGFSNELKVRTGDDVVLNCSTRSSEQPTYSWQKEGSDWILPSSTLTLKKVSAQDEGRYTCMAEHPLVESLKKKYTISVTVLPEDCAWYETTNGRLWLMTSAGAVSLVVFILAMSVFLCRRAKRARTNKGPIDDHSQKKPIYKTSVESLTSTSADEQPLV